MVSIEQIKELRKLTGAGIADCKKALAVNNNLHDAQLWLQAKGIEKIAQNADREALEGYLLLSVSKDQKFAHVLEINTETDFLAESELFQDTCKYFLQELSKYNQKIQDVDIIIKNKLQDLQMRSKENARVGIYYFADSMGGVLGSYLHKRSQFNDVMGKVLGLVVLKVEFITDNLREFAKQLAMHIVAQAPKYLNKIQVSPDIIKGLSSIYLSEVVSSNANKPQHVIDLIVQNKIDKYLEQVVLEEQLFVMDNSKKIKQLLSEINQSEKQNVSLVDYCRLEVGKPS